MKISKIFSNPKNLYFLVILSLFVITFIISFFSHGSDEHFVYLARSFLRGKLYFSDTLYTWHDTAFYKGNYFWPLGFFPSLLIIPMVYVFDKFGVFFYQGYFQFFIVIGIFTLIFKIAKHIGFSSKDSLLWSLVFCFGSVFIGVAWWPWSWFYSQVVTVFLLLLMIYMVLLKKQMIYIGIICGLILLTRSSAFLSIIFPLFVIAQGKEKSTKEKLNKVFWLMLPIIGFVIIWLSYNYARFHNPFEQGYRYQILANEGRRTLGVFSYKHIPTNLYYLLLSGPEPVFREDIKQVLKFPFIKNNEWGISMFITSPYLIYLFAYKRKSLFSIPIIASTLVILLPILLYYGIGARQYGYRYSLDFLPLLFTLLMHEVYIKNKQINHQIKKILWLSIYVNVYLFLTLAVN